MRRLVVTAALIAAILDGPAPVPAQDEIFVANLTDASVTVYARLGSGNVAPLRTLRGPSTGLAGVWGVAVDLAHGELFVANTSDTSIAVFDLTAAGDTAPKRKLTGAATLLNSPRGIAIDPVHDELVVSNVGNASITVYARAAGGNVAPLRVIQGPNTMLSGPIDVAVDWVHEELVVANQSSAVSVSTFARTATGDVAPLRRIAGDQTTLSIPRGVALDLARGEIAVADNDNQGIAFFARTATGNVAPLRRLIGPDTLVQSPNSAAIDGVNGELLIPNFVASSIIVHALPVSGNTPPLRTIAGGSTGMNRPVGIAVTAGSGCGTAQVGALALSRPVAAPAAAGDVTLAAAILPGSRSVRVGCPATAFATVINSGTSTATGVSIAPASPMAVAFAYQTTDPHTNALTGAPNTPVNIPAGQSQSFLIAITPQVAFGPVEVAFTFAGGNTAPVGTLVGTNTLLLSGTGPAAPDIVALVATVSQDGIANIPGPTATGFFTAATVNVGAGGGITVTADTGTAAPPVILSLCQTDPVTGVCLATPAGSVVLQIDSGQTPTFAVFATGTDNVVFDPAVNRIFLRFKDAGGVTRGSASVAVRTQ